MQVYFLPFADCLKTSFAFLKKRAASYVESFIKMEKLYTRVMISRCGKTNTTP